MIDVYHALALSLYVILSRSNELKFKARADFAAMCCLNVRSNVSMHGKFVIDKTKYTGNRIIIGTEGREDSN